MLFVLDKICQLDFFLALLLVIFVVGIIFLGLYILFYILTIIFMAFKR